MFESSFLLIGLTVIGALSPLLTFCTLFQQKEWRWDRLQEHLRRDGLLQLIGRIRPLIAAVALVAISFLPGSTWLWLSVFALLSILQVTLRKQRIPKATQKALLVVILSVIATTILGFQGVAIPWSLPLLLLLQPLVVLGVWALLLPLDFFLKRRVMNRARNIRKQFSNATVIGIAGSVGKTTVKELLRHVLQDLQPFTTPAHVNTEMGVSQWLINNNSPFSILNSPLLIVEMGAYRTGEIALLSSITQPTIGVLTALGSDHIALFGSEEAIIAANTELLQALPKNGHAFLYGGNPGCKQAASSAPCPISISGEDTLQAQNVAITNEGITFQLGETAFKTPLQGAHNLGNILVAIGVARHLGIHDARIAELLASFHSVAHTFNVRTERGVLLLDDTYNISPLSFGAALDWAAEQIPRPRVLLTSGLQESGANEQQYLDALGTKAAHCIERVIFTDSHGKEHFEKSYGKPVEILNTSTEHVQPGSALLCVGRMSQSTIQKLLPPNS